MDFHIDDEIRNMSLDQMRRERVFLTSELSSIDAQISSLAFNNYGTYADAGRATHDCSKTFVEMRDKTGDLSSQADQMTTAFQEFRAKAKILGAEQEIIKKALDKTNPIWELLSLPSRMDICIRAGYYDLAYSLTNYGMQLQQQSQLIKNPLIKKVADRLVEARSHLLEELFNKFAGPLDLAESIKVVNNVRKMPYLTANQLRIAVLQHRDIYLDKQILEISGNTDMIIQAIEIYRTCMYDTLVLYLAVFPENELIRKSASADPRWEAWTVGPPSSILSQWVLSNVKRLLELIERVDLKTAIDISTVWSKLMTMAASFGRMGIDFRPLIASRLSKIIESRFVQQVQLATTRLTGSTRDIVMIGIDPTSLPQFETAPNAPPCPSAELSLWDDLTVYANSIVDAMNGLRFVLTPTLLSTVVVSLRDSIRSILSWLATSHSTSANFSRAIRVICTCLAPFFEKCIAFLFPPTAIVSIFGSSISKQQYIQFIEIDMQQLAASCDEADRVEEIVKPLMQKKSLADFDLEAMLKTKEAKDPKFFLEEEEEEDVKTAETQRTEPENLGIQKEKETKIIVPEVENSKIQEDAKIDELEDQISEIQEDIKILDQDAKDSKIQEEMKNDESAVQKNQDDPKIQEDPKMIEKKVENLEIQDDPKNIDEDVKDPKIVEPEVQTTKIQEDPKLLIEPAAENLEVQEDPKIQDEVENLEVQDDLKIQEDPKISQDALVDIDLENPAEEEWGWGDEEEEELTTKTATESKKGKCD